MVCQNALALKYKKRFYFCVQPIKYDWNGTIRSIPSRQNDQSLSHLDLECDLNVLCSFHLSLRCKRFAEVRALAENMPNLNFWFAKKKTHTQQHRETATQANKCR